VFEKLLELRQTLDGLFMCNAAKEGAKMPKKPGIWTSLLRVILVAFDPFVFPL
jgi:hypothetical protein